MALQHAPTAYIIAHLKWIIPASNIQHSNYWLGKCDFRAIRRGFLLRKLHFSAKKNARCFFPVREKNDFGCDKWLARLRYPIQRYLVHVSFLSLFSRIEVFLALMRALGAECSHTRAILIIKEVYAAHSTWLTGTHIRFDWFCHWLWNGDMSHIHDTDMRRHVKWTVVFFFCIKLKIQMTQPRTHTATKREIAWKNHLLKIKIAFAA